MILHMENYCQLLFLLLFIVSMFGSLTRSDYNSTYSLLSYVYLSTYRVHIKLASALTLLIAITAIVLIADLFAALEQQKAKAFKIGGFVLISFEMLLKVFMLVLLSVWKFRGDKTNEKDFREEAELKARE